MSSLSRRLVVPLFIGSALGLGACGGAGGGGGASVASVTGSTTTTGGAVNFTAPNQNSGKLFPKDGILHDGMIQNLWVADRNAATVSGQSVNSYSGYSVNKEFFGPQAGVSTPASGNPAQNIQDGYIPLSGVGERVAKLSTYVSTAPASDIYLSKVGGLDDTLSNAWYGIYQTNQTGSVTNPGATIGAFADGMNPTFMTDLPKNVTATYKGSFVGALLVNGDSLASRTGLVGDTTLTADFGNAAVTGRINNITTPKYSTLDQTTLAKSGSNGGAAGFDITFNATIYNMGGMNPQTASLLNYKGKEVFGVGRIETAGYVGTNTAQVLQTGTNNAAANVTSSQVLGQFYNAGATATAGTIVVNTSSNPLNGAAKSTVIYGGFGGVKQ